jgi:hypothetical protein
MNTKIVDYKILWAIHGDRLTEAVKKDMTEGWEPIGGVCVAAGDLGQEVFQAMVKRA